MSDTRVEAVAPPLDSQGFLRWTWRQLTSMRVALILLFALAVASVPGSILPQRGNNPLLVDEWIDQQPLIDPRERHWAAIDVTLGDIDPVSIENTLNRINRMR